MGDEAASPTASAPERSLESVLDKYGLGTCASQVLDAVDDLLARSTGTDLAPRSQADVDYLQRHSGLEGVDIAWLVDHSVSSEAAHVATSATVAAVTLSRSEAAELLGVTPSRISHRLREGAMWAVRVDGSPRLPRWQFHDRAPLPGMAVVAPALDALDMDPVGVASLMNSPTDLLEQRSPVEHLLRGGDPALVVGLLDSVARA